VSKYGKGRTLEYELTADGKQKQGVLVASGYLCMRAPGSKGPHKIDVIAWKLGERLAVQCKLDGDVPRAERVTFIRSAILLGAVPLVAYWHKNGSAARVVRFDELTGPGPRDRRPWSPDWALEMP
jgi:Holliday junction resolvase